MSTEGPVCRITGKVSHGSRSEAEEHLRSLRRYRDRAYAGHSYRCSYCERWHIGRIRNPKNGRLPGRLRHRQTK